MKTSTFFALVGAFLIVFLVKPTDAKRLDQYLDDNTPNYVVIGAFSKQPNAVRFTKHAQRDLKLDAKFEMNRRRNLYYVYVLSTQDLTLAITEAKRLRSESEFTDTWVYRGSFTGDLGHSKDRISMDIVPAPDVKNEPLTPADSPATQTPSQADPTGATTSQDSATAPLVQEDKTPVDDGQEGEKFVFKLTRISDAKRVQGDVDIIDVDRQRKMGSYKGNMPVKVSSPNSKSGNISVICEVFGYKKTQRDLNYNDPESGTDIIRDATGSVVVPFELTRLKKGDIAIMYNVYFFKDASIMRPESRFEVNSLLDMLNENPKYKIRLHGHTNGNATGKIISMSKDSKNFFALNDTKEGFGSAKQLSEERARIIRDYMVNNGIDPKRMEIKAWGGKKPIHDKMSNRAQENVRVEVEILED